MDENQEEQVRETTQPIETSAPTRDDVSFSTIGSSPQKPKNSGKIFLAISAVLILGVLGFFIFKGLSSPSATPTPESFVGGENTVATPEPTATPSIDKTKIKIEVQNGTGITGEAAYLQGVLKNLGYTNIKVGNATSQDNTITTVTFSKDTPSAVIDEITAKLESVYKKVESKTSSTAKVDVLILTGLRKGATPKPSAAPTVKPSASPSATPTASPIPTST